MKPHKILTQLGNENKKKILNELNELKFFFKQLLKISAFYLEKQNSFIPKKKYNLGRSL